MKEIDFRASFREPELARALAEELSECQPAGPVQLMHVCGTHEHSIARAGIRSFLPEGVKLVAGPGCPVCVCPAGDIDLAMQAASKERVILTTFGDMFRVPSSDRSMERMKGAGADIRVVYSPFDSIRIARENPGREVVFMAVGFETTAGPIAASCDMESPGNYSVIPSIRLIPPALEFLLERSEGGINGFILPGHVSTVLGRKGYLFLNQYGIPSVIAGFEPVDILAALLDLLQQLEKRGPGKVRNLYGRVVREEGNRKARKIIEKVFRKTDSNWRGIGLITKSGLRFKDKYRRLDGAEKLGLEYNADAVDILPGCLCHRVILGEAEPEECPLFGTRCTPAVPFGPCMVSSEGTCRARYIYST
ncbi:MAG: hydrogenase formation protein HypD [Candidatus Latescibacteria bacterium]|nr:hydrogenase formation protein HypD [bacterium]MBD3424943.1 hydrogenase formation protein HypD [Candidatus Latescibacterota bacterium]